MKIELKEKSKQLDIKELMNTLLSTSKTYLLDYPYKNMKEAIWEREGKELVTMLSLCTNEYVSVCCKYDVYTKYIWCGLLEDNFFTFSHESDMI